jgi:TPR repeat protein
MAVKTSHNTLFIAVGVAVAALLAVIFLVSQDWKNGRNRIVDAVGVQFANAQGQFEYANRLERFQGLSARKDAMVWYEKAANGGHVGAMMALADRLALRTDEKSGDEAVSWYEKASNAGNAEAMRKLGEAHQAGTGKLQPSPILARSFFEKGAKAGDARAKSLFGRVLMQEGQWKEAEPWLIQAAEAGDVEAYTSLGNIYYDYRSPMKDFKKAEIYYSKAANAGVSEIMFNYGFLLVNGMGSKKDPVEGYKWFLIASEVRAAEMYYALGYMRNHLKPEELKDGETRAAEWRKTHPKILR